MTGEKSSCSTGERGWGIGGEAFLTASAAFVAEVLSVDFFFPLCLLAAMFSQAASSNLLVAPMIAANDGVGPLGGCGGACNNPIVKQVCNRQQQLSPKSASDSILR